MGKRDRRERSTASRGDATQGVREELERLQIGLVQLQRWIVREDAKVSVVFEGRGTAGKGSGHERLTERVSPRVFRVVAIARPNDRERSQMYMQSYVPHLPAGGEVVIFDRSWYNRAEIETVMGFCTEEESGPVPRARSLRRAGDRRLGGDPALVLARGGPGGATRRLTARVDDGRRTWKLSGMDLESYGRWYDYSGT